MEPKHTPTPWKVMNGTMSLLGDSVRPIQGADNLVLGFVSDKNLKDLSEREANAAYIVLAVNAHSELIALLKRAAVVLEGQPISKDIKDALSKVEDRP